MDIASNLPALLCATSLKLWRKLQKLREGEQAGTQTAQSPPVVQY